MARLIDADALMNTLERYVNPMPGEHGNGYLSGLATAMDEVEAAPTVDAVPVVHGRWEIITDDYDCEMMCCSVCRSEFYDGDNDTVDCLHNYCPNCGADMRDGDGNA